MTENKFAEVTVEIWRLRKLCDRQRRAIQKRQPNSGPDQIRPAAQRALEAACRKLAAQP
jgi:hypothetical protein